MKKFLGSLTLFVMSAIVGLITLYAIEMSGRLILQGERWAVIPFLAITAFIGMGSINLLFKVK